ncbi:MAG: helix-turn-helix transcriptional regulator, partial [Raoultibacter sp.]
MGDDTEALVGVYAQKHTLSQRETEVFELLVRGRSAQVIAEKLYISTDTVRVHIKSIYKKLEVHSQQELI